VENIKKEVCTFFFFLSQPIFRKLIMVGLVEQFVVFSVYCRMGFIFDSYIKSYC
jgi:hypothetical protein